MHNHLDSQFVHEFGQCSARQKPLDSSVPGMRMAFDLVRRCKPTQHPTEGHQSRVSHQTVSHRPIATVTAIGIMFQSKLCLRATSIVFSEMLLRLTVLAGVIVAGQYISTPVATAATPSSNPHPRPLISSSGYPVEAFLVPLVQARSLQDALDKHHVIRLESGSYAVSGPASLIIKSDYKVYGLPNTVVPPIIVLPGTMGAVLSYLKTNSLTFPASTTSTHDNLFIAVNVAGGSRIAATNAVIENNLFLSTTGRICFDDSTSGFFRNNRFIRSEFRAGGADPILTFSGNFLTPSYNNTFLMSNFLTPHGNSSFIHGLVDISMVGVDSEAWNWGNLGTHGPLDVDNTVGFMRVLNIGGGTDNRTSSNAVPFAEIGAQKYVVINDTAETSHVPKTSLLSSVQTAVFLNGLPSTDQRNTLQAASAATILYQSAKPDASTLTPDSVVTKAVIDTLVTSGKGRIGEAWEAPTYDPVPDPAGPTWDQNLASQPDSTAYIQGIINAASPGIAFLPAGKYYISRPIAMTTNQGLIGAGMNKTVIIAKNSHMDMIVGGDHFSVKPTGVHFTLSDLTLQGGLNGVHHDNGGTGGAAQYYQMFFSHVTFRNMSNAGVFEDGIYGYDNNLLDHLYFANNKYGFLQIPDPSWKGTDHDTGMGYMDKTVFYANQYIGNTIAVKLQPKRPDYLDVWVNSLFQDNTEGAIQMSNSMIEPVIANSDFINNGGNAVLVTNLSTNVTCVSCRFQAGRLGQFLLSGKASFVDASFSESGGTASILNGSNSLSDFYNSTSSDMPMGTVQNGYLFNNYFALNPGFSYQGLTVVNGTSHVNSGTQVTAPPAHQFLWGEPLLFRY